MRWVFLVDVHKWGADDAHGMQNENDVTWDANVTRTWVNDTLFYGRQDSADILAKSAPDVSPHNRPRPFRLEVKPEELAGVLCSQTATIAKMHPVSIRL